ncbi:MAG: serine hydrolase [Bacteroidota bacterium]
MKRIFFATLLIQLACLSCSQGGDKNQDDHLIGVWSGLLFQTESAYDSIVIASTTQPKEALLYKDGGKEVYPLTVDQAGMAFRSDFGLRFDAVKPVNQQVPTAILTYSLWVQSLDFKQVSDRWVAAIQKPEIIDTDYQVYLAFYRDSIGEIQAKIQSNKENRELHFTIEKVTIDGNNIDLEITNDRFGISAIYDPAQESIQLNYSNTNSTRQVELKKLDKNKLEGYLPRSPAEEYHYEIPQPIDADIEVSSLEKEGINSSMLAFMKNEDRAKLDHIHSIIITKNRKLVFEEYFHGYDRAYLHDIRSAFKSFASLALGKAMMHDTNLTVKSTLADYYPEYDIQDKVKKTISAHHALTMSTGIALEDEDEMQWSNSDWVAYKLNLPMEHEPGEKFIYSSGGSNLLTGVIEKTTSRYLPLFLYEEILKPMGIDQFQMLTSPMGRGYLAGNFYLRPVDFTKFGLLVLDHGKWNGEELIAASWIEESTKPHIKCSYPTDADYGYLWRLLERNINGKPMKTIEAWGNGGQFLIIIPEVEMTITFTGGNYSLFPKMEEIPFEILEKYILPAVE